VAKRPSNGASEGGLPTRTRSPIPPKNSANNPAGRDTGENSPETARPTGLDTGGDSPGKKSGVNNFTGTETGEIPPKMHRGKSPPKKWRQLNRPATGGYSPGKSGVDNSTGLERGKIPPKKPNLSAWARGNVHPSQTGVTCVLARGMGESLSNARRCLHSLVFPAVLAR
jgi:hypothetical protein